MKHTAVSSAGTMTAMADAPPKQTVLLADSDSRRRRMTAIVLRLGGYRVIEVGELREIPEAGGAGVDLLFSDADLSDGDALAYAINVRRDPRTAKIPILIASAGDERRAAAESSLGSGAFVRLPMRPSDLLQRIDQLLGSPGAAA